MSVLVALALSCYLAPVDAPILVPFVEPACAYCSGHRGIEYSLAGRVDIRAAAVGVVAFSGDVAGIRYVVVLGDDGISATYGMLESTSVGAGDRVRAGQSIVTATNRFYFGLRRGDVYLDPVPYIGIVTRLARLVPTVGGRRRAATPRPPRCSITSATTKSSR